LTLADTEDADKIIDALKRANDGMLTLVSSSRNGGYYQQRLEGINGEGEQIVFVVDGKSLISGGYVSGNIAMVGNALAIISDGTSQTSLPTGIFSYYGKASIGGNTTFSSVLEDGTFTMRADFSNKTANITAQTPNKYFSSSNLSINTSSGKFGGTGTIGVTSVDSTAATVVGYFAGYQAEGVHGSVYQNSDVDNGMSATFYGSR
jgi:hypothetical protein